jgi:sec-independent protein translocase protein TatA
VPIIPFAVLPDVGTPELLIVLVIAALVFGGAKLPELARNAGKAVRQFKEEATAAADDAEKPA